MSRPSPLFWSGRPGRLPVGLAGRWLWGRGGGAVLITLASVGILIANARFPSFSNLAGQIDPTLVGLALAASTATLIAKAARWRVLFPAPQRPSLGLATAGIAVGQMVNWALPTRLGEVARVGIVNPAGQRPDGPNFTEGMAVGVGVLIVEKVLDVAMLGVAVVLVVVVAGIPDWFRPYALLVATGFGGLAIGTCLTVRRRGAQAPSARMRRVALRLLPSRVRQLEDPLGAVALGLSAWWSRATAVQVFGWSVIAWGVGALVNVLVLRGFDLHLSPVAFVGATLSVLVALYGGAVIPALPGRLGIFQSLCVLALLPFGVSFERALAISVVMYGVIYLPPIAVGLLAVVLVQPSKASA